MNAPLRTPVRKIPPRIVVLDGRWEMTLAEFVADYGAECDADEIDDVCRNLDVGGDVTLATHHLECIGPRVLDEDDWEPELTVTSRDCWGSL